MNYNELTQIMSNWKPSRIENLDIVPLGDMPGDKVEINDTHIKKANIIFPKLIEELKPVLKSNPHSKAVIGICGGSGVGKSETASLISYYLESIGIGSYTLSGDNYPHRIPKQNDAERLRIYRKSGMKGLQLRGVLTNEISQTARELQKKEIDSNSEQVSNFPWLSVYQEEASNGLRNYLGSNDEINFDELSDIIAQFKNGASSVFLKRMGREETDLWYEAVDFSEKNVIIIEWTHSNSFRLKGVDIPVFLFSTPSETLEHRKARARDKGVDSSFVTLVLKLEQDMLNAQAVKAKIILTKSGEIINFNEFQKAAIREEAGE